MGRAGVDVVSTLVSLAGLVNSSVRVDFLASAEPPRRKLRWGGGVGVGEGEGEG